MGLLQLRDCVILTAEEGLRMWPKRPVFHSDLLRKLLRNLPQFKYREDRL